MRLLVLGASGRTGTEVMREAIAAGHDATAFVRDPAKLLVCEGVSIKTGDARNADDLRGALAGQDAVIVTIGGSLGGSDLFEPALEALVRAAEETGVRRIVMMSTFVTAANFKPTGLAKLRSILMTGFFYDTNLGLERLRASKLDWTIVLATTLTNEPKSGQARIVPQTETVSAKNHVPRADVAAVLVGQATSVSHIRETIVVTRD